MASKNTSSNSRQAVQRSNSDSARWIAGLLLLFIGLFAAAAVFFSFFSWAADQSGLQKSVEERVTLGIEPENLCGWAGARLGMLLVDHSFGLFGILIPAMIVLVGVRIVRQRPLLFNHSILSLFLIMILGSLTLGFAFANRWSLCCSTGWGGAFGIASSALLRTHIGAFGTLILLVGGWILTGVFINRNFINKVNEAGNVVVDKSGKVVEILKHKVVLHGRAAGEDGAAEDIPEPAPKPGPKAAAPQPAPSKAAEPAAQKPAPIRVERPSEPVAARKSVPEEDENPFLELTPDGKPVAGETAAEQTPPPAEDGEFIEVDLSRPEGRVVIGRSGLVELERPAVRDAVAAEPAPEEVPEREHAQSDSDAPFTEITVLDDAPAAEPEGVVVTVEANEAKLLDEKAIPTESYDPLKDLVNYRKPPVTLLEDYISDSEVSDEEIFENKTKIEETLKYFGIPIQRIKATVGPTVTLYEIVQAQGIKISKVQGLENDIAQSLKALGIRIIAPIPGKGTIGIEVPNRDKQVVSMYSAVRSLRFQESKAELPVVIGRTIQNENYVFDLAKMPHLLVAGATGQGKSVGLNAIITSLLYRKHPAQLKFVMIDPKMVEFSLYAKIERHFLAKMESEDDAIITDPKKAVYTLNSLCTEMDNRLELCKKAGARNIAEYNEKFTSRRLNPMNGHRYLPYIVVVVDEFADLKMSVTNNDPETFTCRLAQKARAAGIHLIIGTQRPSVDVITGKLKANIPSRIAFTVMQQVDSRTILDANGAEALTGRGDMLYMPIGVQKPARVQGAFVSDGEIDRVVTYIREHNETVHYNEEFMNQLEVEMAKAEAANRKPGDDDFADDGESGEDAIFNKAVRLAVESQKVATSLLQRRLSIGYGRAAKLIDRMEEMGIVSPAEGNKPRRVLITAEQYAARMANEGGFTDDTDDYV